MYVHVHTYMYNYCTTQLGYTSFCYLICTLYCNEIYILHDALLTRMQLSYLNGTKQLQLYIINTCWLYRTQYIPAINSL